MTEPTFPVVLRRRRWYAFGVGLAFALASAALLWRVVASDRDAPGGRPARPDAALAAQVSLFWGGGTPREWRGTVAVTDPAEPDALAWAFVSDFEEDDRLHPGAAFPLPVQRVPPGWQASAARAVDGRAPEHGAWIEGATAGEADGLVLGLTTAGAALELRFDGATLATTVAELLAGPRVVAADDEGNVLMAQAIDLGVDAPLSTPHGATRAWRTSLHTHSAFSTNEHPIDSTVESLVPFARTVFWTDHNTGDDRHVLAGDFEDPDLVERFWFVLARNARVVEAGRTTEAREGAGAFRLVAEGTGPGDRGPGSERAWIALQRGRGAGEFNVALALKPKLRWAWRAGEAGVPYVDVGLHSGRVLRYRSLPLGEDGGLDGVDAVQAVDGDPGAGWRTFERDVAADVEALLGASATDGLRRLSFGVEVGGGARAAAMFDAIALELPAPDEVVRLQQRLFDGYPELRSFVALEQSAWLGPDDWGALFPHLTAYVPDRDAAPELFVGGSYDAPPSAAERAAFVRRIQAAGGAVGAHHLQYARHYEALLDARGLGIDLFEVGGAWHSVPSYVSPEEQRWRDALGYPAVPEDELFPLLVRWDRATARGLLLALYGAPDLHQRFDRPNGGWLNRWLTSIVTDDGSPAGLLGALRAGHASASDWRSGAVLTLAVDGRPWTGKLVATDRARHTITAEVSGALPGSRLRWIQGPLARADASSPATELAPPAVVGRALVDAPTFATSIELDTRAATFVRAELRNPAGQWVALSNPVVFVPYWPERWPAGRVAFDRGGVALAETRGLRLDEARPGPAGGLVLAGVATDADARLVVTGPVRTLERRGAPIEPCPVGADGRASIPLPAGPFELALGFDEPWRAELGAAVEALPERKQLALAIDLGRPASEAPYALVDFGEPFVDPTGLAHHRPVRQRPASFRLPLPAGEPVWLRLRTQGFWTASGRVELEGRPLGTFARKASATFEVPPQAEAGWRTFTIRLDPPTQDRAGQLLLHRIELWHGPGVVDY